MTAREMYEKCIATDSSLFVYKAVIDPLEIEKVVFNPPATIILWADHTKTVVKCQGDDEFDPEKGMAMAFMKKALGNTGAYNKEITKWCGEYEKKVACTRDNGKFDENLLLKQLEDLKDGLSKTFDRANTAIDKWLKQSSTTSLKDVEKKFLVDQDVINEVARYEEMSEADE